MPPGMVTRRQLADELGVCLRTIDHWIREGICGVKLGVIHVGRQVRIPRANYKTFQVLVNRRRGIEEPTL